MKSIRFVSLIVLAVAVVSCAKKAPVGSGTFVRPVDTTPAPPPAPPPDPVTPAERELTDEEVFARKSLDDLNAERPLGDVLFQVDDDALTQEARTTLQQNAAWLRRWTSTRATIEGHCDERGTSEYNLALGERRARTVKDYLVGLGVDGERLLVVSKGKESPLCDDANEDCWQRNRRAQSIITAK